MANGKKTVELIDRLVESVPLAAAGRPHDSTRLGKDLYMIADYAMHRTIHKDMKKFLNVEDLRQDIVLALWRKIATGKVKYVDRRIVGFLKLVATNYIKDRMKSMRDKRKQDFYWPRSPVKDDLYGSTGPLDMVEPDWGIDTRLLLR